ncbi:MAG: phage holin family protein [Proteobacteria bacterium]|jgi:uncharacterized membrane protein YqjE|nr:phage holin family protein [Pseudomonadota bacterium]
MSGEDGGIRDAASRVGASALALVRTRLELASVEFAQERERIKSSIVLIAAAAVAFALTAMVVTLGVIAWFWDDHRYAAIAIVAIVYAAAGIAALAAQRRVRREGAVPFAATAEALRRDAEWLGAHRPRKQEAGGGSDSGSTA